MNWFRLSGVATVSGMLFFCSSALQAETIVEAIDEVMRSNPEIQSIVHNRLARDQEIRQVRSTYLPKFDVIAGIGINEVTEPVNQSLTPTEVRLSLRQNLFNGFADVNEVDRQEARVRSAAYHLQGTAENVALDAAKTYLDVLKNQDLVDLAEKNLETHLRIGDQISLRSEAGHSSMADNDQARSRVALAQSNVVVTHTNLFDSKSNYLAVVGHLPQGLESPGSPDAFMPDSLEQAEQLALKQHPTLKSAEADLEARREQHEVAKAPYMPIVDVEVDQVWQDDFDQIEGHNEELIAMIRLRYNLFNGFKDKARRVETTELVSEAQEVRNNTQRQVVESIRLSWMAYQAVTDRIPYLKQREDALSDTTEAYAKQFSIGQRTLLDVLDSEAELIDSRKDLTNAKYDGLYAQFRILNGMGMLVKSLTLEWPKEARVEDDNDEKQQPLSDILFQTQASDKYVYLNEDLTK